MSIFDYFTRENKPTFIERIKILCNQSGLRISGVESNRVILIFETAWGFEKIYIRSKGKIVGNEMLEFSSDGIPVPKEAEIAAMFALMLMERNAEAAFGYWVIESLGEHKVFSVMCSAVEPTLDKEEFLAYINGILRERHWLKEILRN